MTAPGLAALQHAFRASVEGADDTSLLPWVRAGGIDPAARLRIYRHAVQAIQCEALATVYPAFRRLVGEACFEGLADRFGIECGGRSGNLQDYGAGFADFVAARGELAALPWLADVARLEWLRQQCFLATDEIAADATQLARQLGAAREVAGLRPRADVRALASSVPVLDLWRFAEDPEHVEADPQGAAQGVLLWRENAAVAMCAVSPAQARLAAALVAGEPLAAACEVAGGDPAMLLQPLFHHGLVAELEGVGAPMAFPT